MRDLILILADSKRLLGTRYAEWILGAPELEAGIACASMAQDEWGHGRLLYALLKDGGDDPEQLEHGREAHEYRNIEVLDQAPQSWPELIVLNALVDTALTVQLEALRESEHAPLRQRIGKVLDEEVFHAQHGLAWLRRLATSSPQGRAEAAAAAQAALPAILRWFGPGAEADALRAQFVERVSPLLAALGQSAPVASFENFDESTRRTRGSSPDADTIKRVRGDKNRQFLMD
ncbi:MAG: Phenylacetic acid catabolic protein [Gemmatimonadota bacterium]